MFFQNKLHYQELLQLHNLSPLKQDPERLAGSRLHQVWKIKTVQGEFVVKELNPRIINQEQARSRYEETEACVQQLKQLGLPVQTALRYQSHVLIPLDDRIYIVFPWIEGRTLQFETIKRLRL